MNISTNYEHGDDAKHGDYVFVFNYWEILQVDILQRNRYLIRTVNKRQDQK